MFSLNVSRSLTARTDAELASSKEFARLAVSLTRTQQYCAVALTTVLVYHSVLTLEKEIKYFWRNPRSSVSIIYFANQYIGLLAAVCNMTVFLFSESRASCLFSFWVSCLAGLVVFFLLDYTLLIRTMALFHWHKKLSVALKTLLGAEVCISFCLLIYVISIENVDASSPVEGMSICSRGRAAPRILYIVFWIVPLMYGLVLLCLALHKTAEYWKMTSGLKGFHLMRVVIQDQVLYYGFFIFCCVCQIVTYSIVESSPFVAVVRSTAGIPILVCTLGSHLLLSLKEAGEKGVNGGMNYTPDISDMDVVENGAGNEERSDRGGSA